MAPRRLARATRRCELRPRLPTAGSHRLADSSSAIGASRVRTIGVDRVGLGYGEIASSGAGPGRFSGRPQPERHRGRMHLHGDQTAALSLARRRRRAISQSDLGDHGRISRRTHRACSMMAVCFEARSPTGRVTRNGAELAASTIREDDAVLDGRLLLRSRASRACGPPTTWPKFSSTASTCRGAAGYLGERADLATFTGDVMDWVRARISSANLVIADLTSANPNVYLEVGYAWGKG